MTPKECLLARMLLEWEPEELARRADVPLNAVRGFERAGRGVYQRVQKINDALSSEGVIFASERSRGEGVKLDLKFDPANPETTSASVAEQTAKSRGE